MADPPRITVLCLDMAGTTVRDDGTVMTAFTAALAERRLPAAAYSTAMRYVAATMGQSKIDVFRHVMDGDEAAAQQVNASFERHYAAAVAAGEIAALPGARELFAACRAAGIRVCLSTGFSPATRDAIIAALGWGPLVDLVLSPADAGRGRPWPDMPLAAPARPFPAPWHLAVIRPESARLQYPGPGRPGCWRPRRGSARRRRTAGP
jgi:phosphonatase-like hydrolase